MFPDPPHEEFAGWALGFAPYGGADVGEVQYLATKVKPGEDDSFFDEFSAFANRRIEEGDTAAAKGHPAAARDCYLRASCLLGVAYHPLFGKPVDPRLVDAFHLQVATFEKAMTIGPPAAEKLVIPYENTTLPAWFVRAPGREKQVRPVVLVGGGWDSTIVDSYFGIGAAALKRGYHVLMADGPGQGRLLFDDGITLRHDWEKVVTPLVDALLKIDVVDPQGIVFQPSSLGGYMAPRAAAFEHRLAAIVCDPGQIDVGVKFSGTFAKFHLSPEAIARLPALSPSDEQAIMSVLQKNRSLYWKVVKRGFWTNGATDLTSFLVEIGKWKLDPAQVAEIRCPTLVTAAESDMASSNAKELYDALKCPKAMIHFSDSDGAGMHCELLNRSMANRQIYNWLDETMASQLLA
jgi:alpha-beta hydrolase superfamily lysophospholipase